LAHSGESPDEERPSLAVRIWRVVVVVLLILALLLVLAYCLTQVNDGDETATPVTSATSAPTRSVPTPTAPTSTAPTSTASRAHTSAAGGVGGSTTRARRDTSTSPTITESATATERNRSAGAATARTAGRNTAAPRAAPNTGGGSVAGAPDLVMVLGGVLLLAASGGLGLFTVRRWRRAW
jgi:cytoskeletal protein RodZ